MKLKCLLLSLITSRFTGLGAAHTHEIHLYESPSAREQLSCPSGPTVPISCNGVPLSTQPDAASSLSQMETHRRSAPGPDLTPEWVVGLVDRQTLLPVLAGSSFLWQTVGFEGHRDRAR